MLKNKGKKIIQKRKENLYKQSNQDSSHSFVRLTKDKKSY